MRWVCSSCGGDDVTVIPSRPSLDDRYAVGYCLRCNPMPTPDPKDRTGQRTRPLNRSTTPLVRDDVWDPEVLRKRREAKADQKLVRDLLDGKLDKGGPKHDQALAVLRRYDEEAAARSRSGVAQETGRTA